MVIEKIEKKDPKKKNNDVSNKQGIRKSNFELLRILLVLMIIVLHYCNKRMGGALGNVEKSTMNYYLLHFMESACIVAVNVFVLITGYFMNDKNKVKINKVINILYLTTIWGVIIFSGLLIFRKIDIKIEHIKTITDRWFVLIFCVLYLIIPYINKFIHSIDRKQFRRLLVILVFCFYIWPMFFENTILVDKGYGITNFIVLYLIGAYIKLYCNDYNSFYKSAIIYLICTIVTTAFSLISAKAWQYNTISNLIGSIALFEMFKAINIKNIKIINKLATYTFSTYIIHENQLISAKLYNSLFKTNEYANNKLMFVNLIITTIGIYIICIVLEKLRRIIMNKWIDKKIDKINYMIEV